MLDQDVWVMIALGLGALFLLLGLGGIVVLIIANKKKVDASPALPTINRVVETDNAVEVPFEDTEFTTTKAASEKATINPLSRRALRQENTPIPPRPTTASSFFAADEEDDDFDFTSGRD